eukprot:4199250-Lingulodinium_polyedra.AAC.1
MAFGRSHALRLVRVGLSGFVPVGRFLTARAEAGGGVRIARAPEHQSRKIRGAVCEECFLFGQVTPFGVL